MAGRRDRAHSAAPVVGDGGSMVVKVSYKGEIHRLRWLDEWGESFDAFESYVYDSFSLDAGESTSRLFCLPCVGLLLRLGKEAGLEGGNDRVAGGIFLVRDVLFHCSFPAGLTLPPPPGATAQPMPFGTWTRTVTGSRFATVPI